jgi:hypothetical protein
MLCDTIDGEGLEITLNIDRITRDEKLLQLKQCDIDGLVLDVHRIRNEFTNLPVKIVKDTRDMRTGKYIHTHTRSTYIRTYSYYLTL